MLIYGINLCHYWFFIKPHENITLDHITLEDDINECVPRTFQDEGVSGVADTVFKTLGDLSFGIGVVAKIFSAAIVSPLGWISNAAFQCSTIADVNAHCSAQEVEDATRWTSIITIIQIPIYLMYGLFLIQLVTNRRIL